MKNLNGVAITNSAAVRALGAKDWEQIAHLSHSTDAHGLSIIPADQWRALCQEASKGKIDLNAMAEQAKRDA